MLLGQVYMVLNRKVQAESAFSQMLEAARASGDVLAEGQALSRLSIARYWLYRFDEARAAGEMALRLATELLAGRQQKDGLCNWLPVGAD